MKYVTRFFSDVLMAVLLAGWLVWTMAVALWVVVITALVSAADYFRRFNDILSPRVAEFRVPDKDRKAG